MKIAIIGGGASGMVTAYLLDKYGHQVTVFEKQAILGGHIRTTNKNVKLTDVDSVHQPAKSPDNLCLEGGVIEFPIRFYQFLNLMTELGVELEPVNIGSGLFFRDGKRILSGVTIRQNFRGMQRLIEHLRLNSVYGRSAKVWLKSNYAHINNLRDRTIANFLPYHLTSCTWIKLLIMYSYSMCLELVDDFPAELAIPALRNYIYTGWMRIKGGVYTYIEKILAKFQGNICLNAEITDIFRQPNGVKIKLKNQPLQTFDKVVFATPPEQVMKLLSDPCSGEIKRFSQWQSNQATTILHTDMSMYRRYRIENGSEFDFFQTENSWGYNANLNQLCGISSTDYIPSQKNPRPKYGLAFNLDSLIAKDQILTSFAHETPLYTVEALRYRDEIIMTNGDHHTYHVGAYLGDGLHEGAIASAIRVANAIGQNRQTPAMVSESDQTVDVSTNRSR